MLKRDRTAISRALSLLSVKSPLIHPTAGYNPSEYTPKYYQIKSKCRHIITD